MTTRLKVFIFISIIVGLIVFSPDIQYFFSKSPTKNEIILLKKEADENNMSAVLELIVIYNKNNNEELHKKYLEKYKKYLSSLRRSPS